MGILRIFFILFLFSCQSFHNEGTKDFHLGNEYARDGLYREAIAAYRRSLKVNPKSFSAHRNLAFNLLQVGNYRAAIAHFKMAGSAYENDFLTIFYMAESYRGLEQYSDAIYYYEKALRLKPNDIGAERALAWSYFNTRFYAQALKLCQKMYKANASDFEVQVIYSRVLLKLHEYDQVMSILNESNPGNDPYKIAQIKSLKGELYFALGQFKNASQLFRAALKQQPLLASALLGLGKCELKANRFSKAIDYLERALRVKPQLSEGYYYLAQSYEGSDPKKALGFYQQFRKQIATDPEYVSMLPVITNKISVLSTADVLK